MACYLCLATDDLRTCEWCKRPVCRACAVCWRDWWFGERRHTLAECRPCALAYTRRLIALARPLAGDVEPAPPFEQFGL